MIEFENWWKWARDLAKKDEVADLDVPWHIVRALCLMAWDHGDNTLLLQDYTERSLAGTINNPD